METRQLDALEDKIDLIMNNHLVHVHDSLTKHESVLGVLTERVDWLVWAQKLVIGGIGASIIVAGMDILLKR